MTEPNARATLHFWTEDVGPKQWYNSSPDLDQATRDRFAALWASAHVAGAAPWRATPEETLASLLLLDQFPRNMFRGRATAFATDELALAIARDAVAKGEDLEIEGELRRFFYMPFAHSEDIAAQQLGITAAERGMPGSDVTLHCRAHAQVIAEYGRFPFRNTALGRATTKAEDAFMEAGGYAAVVRRLSE